MFCFRRIISSNAKASGLQIRLNGVKNNEMLVNSQIGIESEIGYRKNSITKWDFYPVGEKNFSNRGK